jgi:hypothetical protein
MKTSTLRNGKGVGLAILFLVCLASTAQPQEQKPELLIRAAHCLDVKRILVQSPTKTKTLGFLLDEKSYPNDKVLYIVQYASKTKSNGWVYFLVLTKSASHEVFDYQNNARFVLSNAEPGGVSFVDPPLGGAWTQAHIASAITQIEKQPRFDLTMNDLQAAQPEIECESYVDR